MNLFLSSIAGLLSGILGAMGMGGGGVLIIYLVLFAGLEQTLAQGINLIFFIPSAIIATIIYWKKNLIEWRIVFPVCGLGIIGSIIGSCMSSLIDANILRKLFGVLLLFMSIKQFRCKEVKKKH